MRYDNCKDCEHLRHEYCEHHKKPIKKVRGCSLSASGRQFFRATSGKEAFRMNILNKHRKEEGEE